MSLKMERVLQEDYANYSEAMADVADYVVDLHNSIKLHSKQNNLLPNAFERRSTSKKSYQAVRNYLTTTICFDSVLFEPFT